MIFRLDPTVPQKRWSAFTRYHISRPGAPPYLDRWVFFKTPGPFMYLHRFQGPDWAEEVHSHPFSFISIGICGWYVEKTLTRGIMTWRAIKAPFVRFLHHTAEHAITDVKPGTYTLVLGWRKPGKLWGFRMSDGSFMPHEKFIEYKKTQAAESGPTRSTTP